MEVFRICLPSGAVTKLRRTGEAAGDLVDWLLAPAPIHPGRLVATATAYAYGGEGRRVKKCSRTPGKALMKSTDVHRVLSSVPPPEARGLCLCHSPCAAPARTTRT